MGAGRRAAAPIRFLSSEILGPARSAQSVRWSRTAVIKVLEKVYVFLIAARGGVVARTDSFKSATWYGAGLTSADLDRDNGVDLPLYCASPA